MEGLEVPADRRHRRLARLVVRLMRVVRVRVESRAVGVQKLERLLDRRYKVVSHGHGEVRLDHDAEHGRARVRVVEEVVRLLGDRVLHVHLVAADVPVLLGDGVLEVYIIIRGVQGRVDARRDLRVIMSRHRADPWTPGATTGRHFVSPASNNWT